MEQHLQLIKNDMRLAPKGPNAARHSIELPICTSETPLLSARCVFASELVLTWFDRVSN